MIGATAVVIGAVVVVTGAVVTGAMDLPPPPPPPPPLQPNAIPIEVSPRSTAVWRWSLMVGPLVPLLRRWVAMVVRSAKGWPRRDADPEAVRRRLQLGLGDDRPCWHRGSTHGETRLRRSTNRGRCRSSGLCKRLGSYFL